MEANNNPANSQEGDLGLNHQVADSNNLNPNIAAPAVSFGATVNQEPKRKLPIKKIILILLGVLLLAGVAILIWWFLSLRTERGVTIGGTTITREDVNNYRDQVQRFLDENPGRDFGNDDLEQVAKDDLIMNAALKYYAGEKCGGVTVTNQDILNLAGISTDSETEAEAQIEGVLGGENDFRYIRNENATYQDALQNCIIMSRSLFSIAINYDAPHFVIEGQSAFDQARQILNDKYMPMFRQGLSKEEIAGHADVNFLADDYENPPSAYFDKIVVACPPS